MLALPFLCSDAQIRSGREPVCLNKSDLQLGDEPLQFHESMAHVADQLFLCQLLLSAVQSPLQVVPQALM